MDDYLKQNNNKTEVIFHEKKKKKKKVIPNLEWKNMPKENNNKTNTPHYTLPIRCMHA